MMEYRVDIDMFKGPFDLLVHLIEEAKMDIYDIEISEITKQYLEYLATMEELNVEIATEFIVLAATLMEIKSKMLLPRIDEEGQEIEAEDPRAELVERLVEYKQFRGASEFLFDKEDLGRNIFVKPQEDFALYLDEEDEILILDAEKIIKAFQIFINKKKKLSEMEIRYDRVPRKRISSEERARFIETLFKQAGKDLPKERSFMETLENPKDPYDIALSFSSVLEMVKQDKLKAKQNRIFGEIMLKAGNKLESEED